VNLILPHPRMHLRRFVLEPLSHLDPNLIHPTLNQSIGDLLRKLGDS
jgi:2-amino-4-hydroxy-6-hydroxymethyldihydropteridine diphosphokinase